MRVLGRLVASACLAVGAIACGGDDGDASADARRVLIACNEGDDAGDSIIASDLADKLKTSVPADVGQVAPSGYCVRVTFADSATAAERKAIETLLADHPDVVEMRYED